MKRLFVFLALCLPIYLFAQGFGSFTHDQPYFATDRTSGGDIPCNALEWNPTTNAWMYSVYDFNCLSLSDGDLITSVSDISTNSYTLTTTNSPYCTNNVAEIGNRKYGYFDGTNNYLTSGDQQQYSEPLTTFIVAQTPNPNTNVQTLFDNSLNNSQPLGMPHSIFTYNSGMYTFAGFFPGFTQTGPYFQNTNWVIMEVYWDGANSSIKTNGVLQVSDTFGTSRYRGVTLGSDRNFTNYGNSKIAWFGNYVGTVNSTTTSNIWYYLSDRFDIPLATTNRVPTNFPAASGSLMICESDDFDAYSGGASVTNWLDKFPSGNKWISGATAPIVSQTNLANGHATLRFNDTAVMTIPPFFRGGYTGLEIMVVFQLTNDPPVSPQTSSRVFQFNPADNISEQPFTDGNWYEGFGRTTRPSLGNPTTNMSTAFVCMDIGSMADGSAYDAWINAENFYHVTSGYTYQYNQATSYRLGHSTSGLGMIGNIAALYLWDHYLTGTERTNMRTYINDKWGTSIP